MTMSDNDNNQDKGKVLVIAGYGPSIGYATAYKFGSMGFAVACLGRTMNKVMDGVQQLSSHGIKATAFRVDCGDANAVRRTVEEIHNSMGHIAVIVWNATSYVGPDLLATTNTDDDDDENDVNDVTNVFHDIVGVGAVGITAMVQASRKDLKETHGSVLITGGGLSSYDVSVNQVAANHSWDGLALCKSIQRKMAGLLHERLKEDKIFVGTVIISGPVRVGGGDKQRDDSSTKPAEVADAFWEMHQTRGESEIHVGSLEPLINDVSL